MLECSINLTQGIEKVFCLAFSGNGYVIAIPRIIGYAIKSN